MSKILRPRQADVAKIAGVSPAVVSLVINGNARGKVQISSQTQKRVLAAVQQLGYVPNPVARSLATGRNRLLGIFTYEAIFPLQKQNFYFPFLIGIEEEVEAQDYNLLLFTRQSSLPGKRSIYKDGVNQLKLSDGAILLGTHEDRNELGQLLREGFPFVFIGRREVTGGEISYVEADYGEATVEIVRRLVELGHQHLAYIGAGARTEAAQDRKAGYLLAHERLGLPLDESHIHHIDVETISPDVVSAKLINRCLAQGVTALVVQDTVIATHLLNVALTLDKHSPRDFSLAALGDVMSASEVIPEITTVSIPRQAMGAHAVRLLTDMLAQPELELHRTTLPCAIASGNTIAAPPAVAKRPSKKSSL